MAVDHYMLVGGFLHGVEIVVVGPLAVMVLALGEDIADVSALDCIVAILVHQVIGGIHVTLVVGYRSRGLVVHHELDTLGVGILVESCKIEVGIWCDEIEHIVLLLAEPVLPAYVPALDKELIHTVVGRKVDIAANVGVVGSMPAVGRALE